jgi:hypothetical protein
MRLLAGALIPAMHTYINEYYKNKASNIYKLKNKIKNEMMNGKKMNGKRGRNKNKHKTYKIK